MHGWTSCRDKTTELLDEASDVSVDHRRCLTSAVLARVSSLSVDPLAALQADSPPVPGANEATSAGINQLPQTSEESSDSCTLDNNSKVIALLVVCLCWKPDSDPLVCVCV